VKIADAVARQVEMARDIVSWIPKAFSSAMKSSNDDPMRKRLEYKMQDARYKIQDTRYKMQDTRCKMQDTRSRTQELFILHSILFRLELKSW
jgi:division protein CdvB (Snf7/Vps24/ESCRT-III family)